MPHILSRRDVDFVLYDVLETQGLFSASRFSSLEQDVCADMLDAAERLAEEKFQPHAAKSDANEPLFENGRAITIPEIKAALDAYVEAGFMGLRFDGEIGGLQAPFVISSAINAIFSAANGPTASYTMLTQAAAGVLASFGDAALKARFLLPLVAGKWFGTMCLSEPHAGSSLADISTRALPQADGTYRLFGSKMWISGGEHEISENIIHLVLAKTPDAPPGVGGISLFLAPKFLVEEDGRLGSRNDIALIGLNHKMGCRGTVNALLSFGSDDGAVAYRIGAEHAGLSYMFQMMNEARIAVGLGAATAAYSGYLHALDYAKTRRQGRLPGEKDPAQPMVALIEHADVKRMLLQQKSYAEGALALCLYAARLVDDIELSSGDQLEQKRLLLELLTPIVKSWPSEFGLRANEQAIQIYGGYGYTRDFPVERLYRDNRLNAIHEGTKGIQGLDLLGRKARMKSGAALRSLDRSVSQTVADAWVVPALKSEASALDRWRIVVMETSATMIEKGAREGERIFLANATLYLDMMGHLVVAWLWLRMALAAEQKLARVTEQGDRDFLSGKVLACRYFFTYEATAIKSWGSLLCTLDRLCLDAPAEAL